MERSRDVQREGLGPPSLGRKNSLDLEAYRTALETRNMEIGLFWQRSNYFLVLNTALAAGFFTLDQEAFIVLLSLMGVFVSGLWVLVNLGGKYWQSRWEQRLRIIEDRVFGAGSDLFAAGWDTTDRDVEESLEHTRGGRPNAFRRVYHKGVMSKPSVSLMMTILSASFIVFWLSALFAYLISLAR
jgi:hypothetical protein